MLCAFLGMLVLATNGGSFHNGPNELKTVPKTCLYLLPVTFSPLQSNIFRHSKSGARMRSEECCEVWTEVCQKEKRKLAGVDK